MSGGHTVEVLKDYFVQVAYEDGYAVKNLLERHDAAERQNKRRKGKKNKDKDKDNSKLPDWVLLWSRSSPLRMKEFVSLYNQGWHPYQENQAKRRGP